MVVRSIRSKRFILLITLAVLCYVPFFPSKAARSSGAEQLLQPEDFEYLGAFLVPTGEHGGSSFAYGGSSLAWRPDGDPQGEDDPFPGSLYLVGHTREQQVAEISIPAPILPQGDAGRLNRAEILQPFADVTGGLAANEIGDYRIGGLAYVDTGLDFEQPRLYWTAYRWYNVAGQDLLSHGSSALDLADPDPRGMWRLADFHNQMTAGYLLKAPVDFANTHLNGDPLISGLNIQQGVATSSSGPALFAFAPWLEESWPLPPGTALGATPLLYYPFEVGTINDHKNPDEWEGAAWVTAAGRDAVVIVGRKSLGPERYGLPAPGDCSQHQGYHGDPYQPQILLYNPADLAAVSAGTREPWQVQPYARFSPEDVLLPTCEWFLTGASYDTERQLLYITQPGADTVSNKFEPYPVINVFKINPKETAVRDHFLFLAAFFK